MSIPSTIKVNGTTYAVRLVDDLHDRHQPLWGWHNFETCELSLNTSLSEQARTVVLWHEVIHAILTASGQNEANKNEPLIDALSYGIVQVLRDNPEMGTP